MRRAALGAALFCLVLVWSTAVAKAKPASAEDQVLAADQARADALTHQDYDALDKILADDMTYCHATGRVDPKSAFMDTLRSGRSTYVKFDRKDAHARVSGKMAVINGEYIVQTKGPTGPLHDVEDLMVTAVYEMRDGRWQLISSQSTRKTPPAEGAAAPGR
jgi:ketosteroid isomerase-like protein